MPGQGGNFTLLGLLGGLPGFKGRGGGHLDMTLRHPYEDRRVDFHRHRRWCRVFEILLLAECRLRSPPGPTTADA
ncbi:hypothetical protein P6B95_01195 [Streptomyces atratus]|uniref:hypothetical protein n=1 Tax=Streptomyces atratus TaxID=1893 RepID=UPI0016717023|nr:hypothetical protein [Streptomyces atratus]WPW26220.1 hypothetical protein P6B95_01195 [Streptomyces atratus]GGT57057.1 hypothetical protein GCM10010207_66080 [Streptomyces atratus]